MFSLLALKFKGNNQKLMIIQLGIEIGNIFIMAVPLKEYNIESEIIKISLLAFKMRALKL